MADKEPVDDEYQFTELDALDNENSNEDVTTDDNSDITPQQATNSEQNNIKRIFLIFVPLLIVGIVLYKIIDAYFLEKTPEEVVVPTPVTVVSPKPIEISTTPPVVQPVLATPVSDPKINDKIMALDQTQQTMRAEVAGMHDELSTLSKNMDSMLAKMVELNAMISKLGMKVDEDSHRIEEITIRLKPKKIIRVKRIMIEPVIYYIKAVIPGRAWLIGSDGSTLTVSKGITVPGYGVVVYIDAIQGRVTTNTGRVIRFSKDDT